MRSAIRLAVTVLSGAALLIAAAPAAGASPDGDRERAVIPTTERIFGWIRDLTELGYRRTGTPGGRAASRYVHDRFDRSASTAFAT
jgi:hypothetical protein